MVSSISSLFGYARLPARRGTALLMGIASLFMVSYIFFGHLSGPTSLPTPYTKQDIERICSSSGGERIGLGDFDKYQPGSKDTWIEEDEDVHWSGDDDDLIWEYEKSAKMIDTNKLLLGPPTPHFKDNLRPELKYITGWYEGGFTNQFMGITHLILISKLTPHHIPVIPPFMARPHLPVRAGMKHVSAIFDLERWARSIDKHVVEWKDVKDLRGIKGLKALDQGQMADEQDEMGCWSVWATANLREGKPYEGSYLPSYLNLDISYTPIPREARLYPYTTEGDLHVTFNSLSVLAHSTPINPNPLSDEKLKPPTPNPQNKRLLYPDPHLTCFDFLYWVTTGHVLEWTMAYSSAWNVVGKYARWSDHVRGLARTTLALTLGMKKRDVMWPGPGDQDWRQDRDGRKFHPRDLKALDERDKVRVKFITIHARRGDFLNGCQEKKEKGLPCFPDMGVFDKSVIEVEEELRKKGLLGWDEGRLPVVMTSDETDPEWWGMVENMGWKRIVFPDELSIPPEVTIRDAPIDEDWGKEIYEKIWERMLVEVAIQGFGTGFVGTQESTMSLVAARRVEHWQGGASRIVQFTVW